MTDGFVGAWMVTEYVYDGAGVLLGRVLQDRTLDQLSDTTIRVTQQCRPEPDLAGHPMADFAGEWVFDLRIEGADRLYLGPDVVGRGRQWADGVMTGQGIWPRFGHGFRSFSVMAGAQRQLTGGTFTTGARLDASIAGIAIPADGSGNYPQLSDVSPRFAGLPSPWVSRSFGPVQESEAWFAHDDQRRRLVIHDAETATFTTVEVHNETAAEISSSTADGSAG